MFVFATSLLVNADASESDINLSVAFSFIFLSVLSKFNRSFVSISSSDSSSMSTDCFIVSNVIKPSNYSFLFKIDTFKNFSGGLSYIIANVSYYNAAFSVFPNILSSSSAYKFGNGSISHVIISFAREIFVINNFK